jgi:hypothetical protein
MQRVFVADNILRCPFCSRPLDEPREINGRFGNTFTGGSCECGAAYVFDQSGHNLGDAYVDALTYACGEDWDKAWDLIPDEDYEVKELSYDSRRNKFSGNTRRAVPAFVFVLLKQGAKGTGETPDGPEKGDGEDPGQ